MFFGVFLTFSSPFSYFIAAGFWSGDCHTLPLPNAAQSRLHVCALERVVKSTTDLSCLCRSRNYKAHNASVFIAV